ncbi:carbohydrate ABC transporter permease [Devosia epidermidihirudinis]|nr:carbohydrate ABC transporter permease [Devosia epidermidihirudinis]
MATIVRKRKFRWDRFIANAMPHAALIIFAFVTLMPLLLIVSASFSDDAMLTRRGFSLLPQGFTTFAYQYVADTGAQIYRAYMVTVGITVVGTTVGLFIMSLLAYALSRPDFRYRRLLSFLVFFTLLFNGGFVPFYILMTQYLGLVDNYLALVLPNLVNVFFVLILRTYFAALPGEVFEAARMDGAGEFRIFLQIAMPMAGPALATVGLMTALTYWNEWVNVLYFIRDPEKVTLQYLLFQIQQNIQLLQESDTFASLGVTIPAQSVRMAIAVIATGPAALLFLVFQKYLVRGATLGAFK